MILLSGSEVTTHNSSKPQEGKKYIKEKKKKNKEGEVAGKVGFTGLDPTLNDDQNGARLRLLDVGFRLRCVHKKNEKNE